MSSVLFIICYFSYCFFLESVAVCQPGWIFLGFDIIVLGPPEGIYISIYFFRWVRNFKTHVCSITQQSKGRKRRKLEIVRML